MNARVAAGRHAGLKDLLRVSDLSRGNLLTVLETARRFKDAPLSKLGELEGETVVLYFNKPSTRTRISFETAIVRLGGIPVSVGSNELQLNRGETIEDTARVISSYASAFVVRTFSDDDVRRFAAAATIPVVNALTDLHHPCQILGDLLTMQEEWGRVEGRRVAYVGDGDNVAHSLLEGCALLGIDIVVASPQGYEPLPGVVTEARRLAAASGSRVIVTNDAEVAVQDADAVYTDVWLSMGVPQEEQAARREAFRPFQVNESLMSRAPHAIFMHCLPAHRGEEVTDEVMDGAQSRVFPQAANRLPTEQALLWALLRGELAG